MADLPRFPQTDDDADRDPGHGAENNRPRWGLVVGIIVAIALIGLIVFLHLTGTLGPGTH
jgi:hypothetical protein